MTASGPARVAVVRAAGGYPKCPPYRPSEPYPELGPVECATEPNHAYAAVRNALAALGLDTERFGTEDWNPLNGIVRPGDSVIIKPNWIRGSAENGSDWECIITHPSVIRAVADYVGKALSGKGSICLADAPQNDADFDVLRELAHVDDLGAGEDQHRASLAADLCEPDLASGHSSPQAWASCQKGSTRSGIL